MVAVHLVGGLAQLGVQALAAVVVLAYSVVATAILALVVKVTVGFRVSDEEESAGIDEAQHAETGYDYSGLHIEGSGGGLFDRSGSTSTARVTASAGQEV